jgi:SepF-like predicted cell division protein (DUF552 family)
MQFILHTAAKAARGILRSKQAPESGGHAYTYVLCITAPVTVNVSQLSSLYANGYPILIDILPLSKKKDVMASVTVTFF